MGAADDWWITLPASRRDSIYRWVTQRRNRRKEPKVPKPSPTAKPKPRPSDPPPGQEPLFDELD